MPPRYAYWTIIVDDQPTAFRSGSQEELMPTFKRLKAKNDTAVMMWFQNGKLWPSRIDAQEQMRARGDMGRRGDERQAGMGFRDRERKPFRERSERVERTAWTPRGEPSTPPAERNADNKLDWKPKGEFVPAPKRAERPDWKSKPSRTDKPEWKPKTSRSEKPEWKPKGSFDREERLDWKPKSSRPQDLRTSRPSSDREERSDWKSRPRSEKPDWKPKPSRPQDLRTSRPSFDREERPRSFKRPDFKPSGDDSRSAKPQWKPKGSSFGKASEDRSFGRERKPEWKPNRDSGGRFSSPDRERAPRTEKLDWKPKGENFKPSSPQDLKPSSPEKRKWVPKEEYKKSMGIEARRDAKWRPGGDHKDPRQKYKDAKKAKWSKFKANIRARSGGKGKKSS